MPEEATDRRAARRRAALLWGVVGALLAGVLLNGYTLATGRGIDAWAVGVGMAVAGVGAAVLSRLAERAVAGEGGNESA
jgi:hypothetical protein